MALIGSNGAGKSTMVADLNGVIKASRGQIRIGDFPITRENLAEMRLTVDALHLKSRPPYRLSGGEKRAVAIAGVLVMQPSILVMDEPSNGLDPAARRRLIKLLASFDHTKIIATHDLDLVLDLCSRVLVMNQGVIEADGTPADIFADADLLQHCNLEGEFNPVQQPIMAYVIVPIAASLLTKLLQ